MSKKLLILLILLALPIIFVSSLPYGYINNFGNGLITNIYYFNPNKNRTIFLPFPKYGFVNYTSFNITIGNNQTCLNNTNLLYFITFDLNESGINETNIGKQYKGGARINTTNVHMGAGAMSTYNDGRSGYLELKANMSKLPNLHYAYSFWVYIKNLNQSEKSNHTIFYAGNTPAAGFIIDINKTGGIRVNANLDSSSIDENLKSGNVLSENKWYYIVTTYDNYTMNIWVNGTLVANDTANGSIEYSGLKRVIGGGTGASVPRSLNGSIDEFGVYNRTMHRDEILFMYNNGIGRPHPDMKYTYEMYIADGKDNITNISQSNKTKMTMVFNATILNSIGQSCDCTNCTLYDNICYIPIKFKMYGKNIQGKITFEELKILFRLNIHLIDEEDNTFFNTNYTDSAKLFFDDNNTVINLKNTNYTKINHSVLNNNFRVELKYQDDVIINRYVDISLIPNDDIRICAFKDGTPYQPQTIISASHKPALLKNIYSNCYVTADYTRFGYQTAYALFAHTIYYPYQLSTYIDGEEIIIAGIDGSISTYMDLDNLELSREGYNINILGDGLTIKKDSESEKQMVIYYRNMKEDNIDINLTIDRMDTNTQVYSKTEFNNLDEFTIYFNYATLNNVTNTTLFKIELSKNSESGYGLLKRYFNIAGREGFLQSGFAFAIAFLLVIFGLTFTVSRLAFSWFGIIMLIAAVGILSMAISTWYIIFFTTICIILIIYIVLVMINKNVSTVA